MAEKPRSIEHGRVGAVPYGASVGVEEQPPQAVALRGAPFVGIDRSVGEGRGRRGAEVQARAEAEIPQGLSHALGADNNAAGTAQHEQERSQGTHVRKMRDRPCGVAWGVPRPSGLHRPATFPLLVLPPDQADR